MSDETTEPTEGKRECVLCDRVWALFGVALGLVFIFISADILSGSALSTMLGGKRREIEDTE